MTVQEIKRNNRGIEVIPGSETKVEVEIPVVFADNVHSRKRQDERGVDNETAIKLVKEVLPQVMDNYASGNLTMAVDGKTGRFFVADKQSCAVIGCTVNSNDKLRQVVTIRTVFKRNQYHPLDTSISGFYVNEDNPSKEWEDAEYYGDAYIGSYGQFREYEKEFDSEHPEKNPYAYKDSEMNTMWRNREQQQSQQNVSMRDKLRKDYALAAQEVGKLKKDLSIKNDMFYPIKDAYADADSKIMTPRGTNGILRGIDRAKKRNKANLNINEMKLNEKRLEKIINESIKKVLNEGAVAKNTPITFGELIKAIGYTGNVNNLVQKAGTYKATPDQWANFIQNIKVNGNRALGNVYAQLANQIRQSVVDQSAVDAGVKKSIETGGEVRGINDMPVKVNPKNFTTIAQAIQYIARQNPNRTLSFQREFTDSTGIFNGLNMAQVQNTIAQKVRVAKGTLQQTNQNAASYLSTIEQWIGQGAQYIPARQLAQAFGALEQILNTARNDIPAVRGFQQTLNLFGLKDTKGKPFAVDGIIGQNTSAALKQNGFNNIFDFINVVKGVQKALGLKDDGIVGQNTLAAFRQNGINSFDALKNFARVKASRENWAQNQISQGNLTMPTPQLKTPQTGGLMRENKKIKVNENELKKLIKESVETILKEYKK